MGRWASGGRRSRSLVTVGAGLVATLLLSAGAVFALASAGVSGWRAVPAAWPWWTNVLAVAAVAASVILFVLMAAAVAIYSKDAAVSPPWRGGWRVREAFRRDDSPVIPARFERMDAAGFEAEMVALLRDRGYAVQATPTSSVHDVDLLLEGMGRTVAVQLKRWNAPVGDRAVYGAFAGRIYYGTDEAWLITTSRFTPKATKLAGTNGVRLVDGTELALWLEDPPEDA